MQSRCVFLAPFIMARAVPHAFARLQVRLQAVTEPMPTMWEENSMEVNKDIKGGDMKMEEALPPTPPPKNN